MAFRFYRFRIFNSVSIASIPDLQSRLMTCLPIFTISGVCYTEGEFDRVSRRAASKSHLGKITCNKAQLTLTDPRDASKSQSRSPNIVPLDIIRYGFLLVFYSNSVPKIFDFEKLSWPWNPGQRSLKVIGTDNDRSATYDFLLTFHSNHGPISHRFLDNRRFQSKIASFSHPRVFCAPGDGVSLGIGYRCNGSKKNRIMGLSGRSRSLTILQPCGNNAPTWQTDRRTERHMTTSKTAHTHSVARVIRPL